MEKLKGLLGITIFFLSLSILLMGQNFVFAQGNYPFPKDKYVNDYANVIEPDTAKELRSQLKALNTKTGIEGTVLTIHSIEDYDTGDESLETFATNLFNTWGIGDRSKNNGFLVVVAVDDRKVRIELGEGYGSGLNNEMQRIINREMLPEFRNENYSQGVYEGTISTIETISGGKETVPQKSSVSIWINVGVVVSVVVGVVIVFGGFFGFIIYDSSKHLSASKRRRNRFKRYRSRGGYVDDGGGGGSSGGGSFDGGSSGGDGASGDW